VKIVSTTACDVTGQTSNHVLMLTLYPTRSLVRSFVRSFIHSLTHSLTHSFTHSFTYSKSSVNYRRVVITLAASRRQCRQTWRSGRDTPVLITCI